MEQNQVFFILLQNLCSTIIKLVKSDFVTKIIKITIVKHCCHVQLCMNSLATSVICLNTSPTLSLFLLIYVNLYVRIDTDIFKYTSVS